MSRRDGSGWRMLPALGELRCEQSAGLGLAPLRCSAHASQRRSPPTRSDPIRSAEARASAADEFMASTTGSAADPIGKWRRARLLGPQIAASVLPQGRVVELRPRGQQRMEPAGPVSSRSSPASPVRLSV